MLRRIAAALLGAIAFGTIGCTKLGSSAGNSLHAWTKPDTVRIGFYEEPDTLNPVIGQMSFSADVFQLVFDGLIRFDERGRPVPDLAREVPSLANGGISKDGKTITYHLMPGAKWHDGVPLTSHDVAFTWRQIMNPSNVTPTRVGYERIRRIDTPDDRTVIVRLDRPYPPALFLFKNLNQGAIVPEHILRGYASINKVPFNRGPIGSGPYIFESWQHGSEMRFRANHAYFRGAPKIEHVTIKFVPDQNTMLSELRTHEVDLYFDIPPNQVERVRAIDGLTVASTSTLHWEHLNFNTKRPPLDDRNVRLALCYAMNEAAIYKKVYFGLGRNAPTHFNPDFGWGDPKIVYYPHDPARAAALLDAAGWKLGADGMRRRAGVPLAFSISTVAGVKPREQIEVLLQSDWHAIGANVTVKNAPAATLFAPAAAGGLISGGKTDVALFTWANSTPDPDDETYISPRSIPPLGQNDSFFSSEEIARAQAAGLATYDLTRRRAAYAKIAHVLIDNVPEYVLDWLPETAAYNTDLHGVTPVPVGSDLWNIATWTLR